MARYFNYRFHMVESGWQRRDFVARWRRIYQDDKRWVPPYWPDFVQAISTSSVPHLARMDPILLYGEALPQRTRPRSPQHNELPAFSGALFEETVVAAILLRDPRRRDGAAYAAALHLANDSESLSRFLARAQEMLQPLGVRSIILPTGLSPYLGSGVLQNYFHRLPPLHSAYNPPYLPELMAQVCRPLGRSLLYEVTLPRHVEPSDGGRAHIQSFDPGRLATDLLPLFQQTMPRWADFPAPDARETEFLMAWLGRWPLQGWLATVDEEAVGFVLMQPDLSSALRFGQGGRRIWWRFWLHRHARRKVQAGRLLLAGVVPSWRRQGIGTQLWRQTLTAAEQAGWQTLSVGPMPSTAVGHRFLEAHGLQSQRTFLLHRYDF